MKAIVTGAANGIGRAVAFRLAKDSRAREGRPAELLLVDLDQSGLNEIIGNISKEGCTAEIAVGDLSNVEFCRQVVVAARTRFGGLDVLVSNAGIIRPAALKDLTLETYEQLFAVNTRATWLMAQAAYPMLRQSKGCIVATASLSGEDPTPPQAAYSATKAALIMLVRQMALEWAPDGIRANCVSPGPTLTKMSENFPELRAARAARIPLGRLGAPEDIANAIAFLAGPEASFITGINLLVDGGLKTTLVAASGSKLGLELLGALRNPTD